MASARDLFRSSNKTVVTYLPSLAGLLVGVLLGLGHFGMAALVMLARSRDGRRARGLRADRLLRAAADRYAEFFAFTGLAFFFRASAIVFTLTLAALIGSLMVSYGTAKAEARHVPVPVGAMRRRMRVACLTAGASLTSLVAVLGARLGAADWATKAPIVLAIGIVAVIANVSAVRRLRAIANAPLPVLVPRDARAPAAHAAAGQRAA